MGDWRKRRLLAGRNISHQLHWLFHISCHPLLTHPIHLVLLFLQNLNGSDINLSAYKTKRILWLLARIRWSGGRFSGSIFEGNVATANAYCWVLWLLVSFYGCGVDWGDWERVRGVGGSSSHHMFCTHAHRPLMPHTCHWNILPHASIVAAHIRLTCSHILLFWITLVIIAL